MDLEALKLLLIKHEGFRLKPYTDTTGNITIGVGHNLTAKGLTPKQVLLIFMDDIQDTLDFLKDSCPWFAQLDPVRQVAIADMAFNLEYKLLQFKNTIAAIEHKDWDAAAKGIERSLFAKQTGQRAKDLADMIRTGEM